MNSKLFFLAAVDAFVERQPAYDWVADLIWEKVQQDIPLEPKQKTMAALMLHGYLMRQGPPAFELGEKTATELGILDELNALSMDWIQFSTNKQNSHDSENDPGGI